MTKRLVDVSPQEIMAMKPLELLDAIRLSEGRTLNSYVCPRASSYVEKVSNIELAAAFGADIITLEGFDPYNIQMPGLPSKDKNTDDIYRRDLQADMGFGWTIRELKQLIGRPIATFLRIVDEQLEKHVQRVFSNNHYSEEKLQYLIEEGYDMVFIYQKVRGDNVKYVLERAAEIAGDRIIIGSGIDHGIGALEGGQPPFNMREIITPEYAYDIAKAGAKVVFVPAVGVVPGYTMNYATEIITAVHEGGAIAAAAVAHSVEGSDPYTIKRIVLDNKICGADMISIAAGGLYESVACPELIMEASLSLKGKRMTYRRMGQSVNR